MKRRGIALNGLVVCVPYMVAWWLFLAGLVFLLGATKC